VHRAVSPRSMGRRAAHEALMGTLLSFRSECLLAKTWISLTIVIVIGIVCFAFFSALRARSLASAYVREVRTLQIAKSGYQDFLAIRYKNASSI
jgi:hypothetical protein